MRVSKYNTSHNGGEPGWLACIAPFYEGVWGMQKYKMKTVLSAVAVVASLFSGGASPALATNINVSAAANFCAPRTPGDPTPLGDLITAFQGATGYTVTLVQCGATGTLASQITGGNSLNVDLFLAANSATPASLASGYGVGSPFVYAVGTLALWSNTTGVNVSSGYNSSTYSKVAVANTTTAPYGTAASQLLTGRYGLTAPLSSNSLVNIYSNIDTTFQAVQNGTETVGFVALSQICYNKVYPTSGSALAYPPTDTSVSPVIYNYDPINQSGLRIARSARTSAEDTALNAFVAYLTDHTLSPQSQMITTLLNYCYGVP